MTRQPWRTQALHTRSACRGGPDLRSGAAGGVPERWALLAVFLQDAREERQAEGLTHQW